MTVAPVVTSSTYALAGANLGPFATVWPYAEAADVAVWIDLGAGAGPVAQDPANFTLVADGTLPDTGKVTLAESTLPIGGAWGAGAKVSLQRATAQQQPSAFGELAKFSPAAAEASDDNLERQVQDLATTAGRALSFPIGEPVQTLPPAAARKGKVLAFDASGDVIAQALAFTVMTTVKFASAAIAAAATVAAGVSFIETAGYAAAGDLGGGLYVATGGASAGGFQTHDGQWWKPAGVEIPFELFGAKGDNASDNHAAWTAAIAWVTAAGGGTLKLSGKYLSSVTPTWPAYGALQGLGRSVTGLGPIGNVSGLIWHSLPGAAPSGSGKIDGFTLDGGGATGDGLIVGYGSDYKVGQINTQNWDGNGTVFVTTQNSRPDQLQSQNNKVGLLLTGGVWNCDFSRTELASATGGAGSYLLLSKRFVAYEALLGIGPTAPGTGNEGLNRKNTFSAPLTEQGGPVNVWRFEDDAGENMLDNLELEGGSPNNPQIYIGPGSDGNRLTKAALAKPGLMPTDVSYAIENHGFGTILDQPNFISWNAATPIHNVAPGTMLVMNPQGNPMLPIADGDATRVVVMNSGFVSGIMAITVGTVSFSDLGMVSDFAPAADATYYLGTNGGLGWDGVVLHGATQTGAVKGIQHNVTGPEAAAHIAIIPTGLVAGVVHSVQIRRAGVILLADAAVNDAGSGSVSVGDGATYVLTAGDKISIIAVGP